jgi:hypothetical protein
MEKVPEPGLVDIVIFDKAWATARFFQEEI